MVELKGNQLIFTMKKTALVSFALLAFPFIASAQALPDVWNPASIKGPLVTCTGSGGGAAGLPACQNLCDLIRTVVNDIYVAIAFVIWIILPIVFIVGGIMYMLAGANPGLLETAKKTLWGALIGAIIVLCAYLLIATFVQFMKVSNIGGFSSGTPSVCTL